MKPQHIQALPNFISGQHNHYLAFEKQGCDLPDLESYLWYRSSLTMVWRRLELLDQMQPVKRNA